MYMLNSCNCFLYECSSCTVFRPPARHTGVLDIYRYTLARRYAGALVYYLARRYAGVRVTSYFLLQQIFTVKTASSSPFVSEQRGDLRAGAFDQYVKNASNDMKMLTSVMAGF